MISLVFNTKTVLLLVKQIVRATKFYVRISNIMNETWLLSAVELQKKSSIQQTINAMIKWSGIEVETCSNTTTLSELTKKFKFFLQDSYSECAIKTLKSQQGKLELYKLTKKVNKFETYLNISDIQQRRAMTKLRVSDHQLPIEIGRKHDIERSKRFCQLCDTNKLGNELHALLECTNKELTKIRFQFLTKITNVSPQFMELNNSDKLVYMLSMHDT